MSNTLRRRDLLALAAFAVDAARVSVWATGVRRIGFISTRSGPSELDAAFQDALSQLGHAIGTSLVIEYAWAAGSEKLADELAAGLVAERVHVIVAATTVGIRAATRATSEIPIVMAAAADPVGTGLVPNLSRPGRNVTGLSLMSSDTAAKRLQLLLEVAPDAKRAAVLLIDRGVADDSTYNARLLDELKAAADHYGVLLIPETARTQPDLPLAYERMRQQSADAVLVPITPFSIDHRKQIIELAAQHRLPSIYEDKRFTAVGGLVSYGPSITDMYRRAATYVDRILKGASPADLPVEQPTRFELSLNLKTAAVLALAIPPTLLARADEVIE